MVCAHRDLATILASRGYQEVRKIGEGSFAKALLVQAPDSSRAVCKVVDVSEASAKEAEDAAKEGRLLASLRHPYIVRYRESFCEDGWLCIIMDFCEGGELAKHIRRARKSKQRIPEDQILRWFTQAMLSLKYIHEKKILHRDLKPANFFLTKGGSLKMGDFGIAKSMACTMACAKTRIGTPYYLSPEVCQERPYAWPSDIWAMGCVLFELCTLRVPFDASNISGLVQKICNGPSPVVLEDYSDFTKQLCSEMLDREPSRRPSADEVLQRPRIQSIVRQMLQEVHCAQGTRNLRALKAVMVEGDFQKCGESGTISYRIGDTVDYYSSTYREWLPARVIDVDTGRGIVIDLKPGTWILKEEQLERVRPRNELLNEKKCKVEAAPYSPPRSCPPVARLVEGKVAPISPTKVILEPLPAVPTGCAPRHVHEQAPLAPVIPPRPSRRWNGEGRSLSVGGAGRIGQRAPTPSARQDLSPPEDQLDRLLLEARAAPMGRRSPSVSVLERPVNNNVSPAPPTRVSPPTGARRLISRLPQPAVPQQPAPGQFGVLPPLSGAGRAPTPPTPLGPSKAFVAAHELRFQHHHCAAAFAAGRVIAGAGA